ncbi:response regulator [Lachnospiraceae bacterium 64-25]|nr:signal transduction histidine-protein kinase BarA [Lachnospiraceae bacterium]
MTATLQYNNYDIEGYQFKTMEKSNKSRTNVRKTLIITVLLVFVVLGSYVFFIASRISGEMSQSAIGNLSENLDLIKGTVEVLLQREAEYQKLIAGEIAVLDDPEAFLLAYERNDTVVKISMVYSGEEEGFSNTGDVFSPAELDFSAGNMVNQLPVSTSYINGMGTWAYTMKCPVIKDGKEIAVLYVEYIYESFDGALPDRFYNSNATLYIMDAKSERFLLKPKGVGERDAGHLNLEDFYRANAILEQGIQNEIAANIKSGRNVMFYHKVQGRDSLIYMWAVNDGTVYLIGYVPVEAIQREGTAVNQNILSVVIVMLAAFLVCCVLYLFYEKQQAKLRKERETEREMHNQQLAEALQAAQVASRSKTTFLSNMSHDIRTPMNAILGFTTLLAKDADNPAKVREYTKKITASGQHLLGLINDVLDVSKIESGKAVLTIGEFTLSGMLSAVDSIIRPAAKEKGQNFEVSVAGIKREYLLGDETRLKQVLINLLSNAVKYTQEGGNIFLRMTGMEKRSDQFEHIRIEVEDNGFGMTPEYLEIIFDAFTRAENSTTNKVQGTGLGMAITKNIVELMGGTIEVASEVGKGSLFTVDLELRIADQEADAKFWREHGIFRILAIDDDLQICQNIQNFMEDTGVLVDTIFEGEAAVDAVCRTCKEGNPYQLILMDFKMPGLDGVEAVRKIRESVSEYIPVLLLMPNDGEEIEEEAVRAGADGFLTKPFFISELREKILERDGRQDDLIQEEAQGKEVSLKGRNFLVAEDNEINAEILKELLGIEGAACEIVANGKLALERFEQAAEGEFDAIIMDVQMPVMNGYEATKHIRTLEREDACSIPIIAMTANAFAEDVKEAIAAGMNAHVSKPVDMELLKRTIYQYIVIERL